ncbi:MAG: N-acetylmuramoyl-L-alanine amidase [Candidatus Cryptobacteroides sp.]
MVEMGRRAFLSLVLFLFLLVPVQAKGIKDDFKEACDSLSVLLRERTSVENVLKLQAVMKRGYELDFYFTESLGDYPLRPGDSKWFRATLKELFPPAYKQYRIGEIYTRRQKITDMELPVSGNDGHPTSSRFRVKDPRSGEYVPFVSELGADRYDKGLSDRIIALWPSHGLYYDMSRQEWIWQRPRLFQSVEDLLSPSFVLPYLTPMLERAGAYVLMPKERDLSPVEVIVDNDPSFDRSGVSPEVRGTGQYSEIGAWKNAGAGFADVKEVYVDTDNPFVKGSARQVSCAAKADAKAEWVPDIPEEGEYAVYVSYKTLPESTETARYTVFHKGGETVFAVNQKMGGGTWVYLGTFPFSKGNDGKVVLDNGVPDGCHFKKGTVVTADAVKIGGGVGNIARGDRSDPYSVFESSGMPRFTEAARYWLQWAGYSPELYNQNESKNDYKDDYMSRPDWVAHLCGGSKVNPKEKGKGIPVDLALAIHTDAGVTPNDSVVGTLSIYTYRNGSATLLPDREDRMTSRELADIVQTQFASDLRETVDPIWQRRQIWDRGYRETRTPGVPAIILEMLSHQNFADMRYALDPEFRFLASRAVYKGVLKYLSNRYGCHYSVQPLPVHSFSAVFKSADKVVLKWEPTEDLLEKTASPQGYIVYTRVDDGVFDKGKKVNGNSVEMKVKPGHIYSYKVEAFNDGGRSFPSEILAVGIPMGADKRVADNKYVLVVNNFTRVSAPYWFDSGKYAGFDNSVDSGVPYISDISFSGEMYCKDREMPWVSNDNPGFGGSHNDKSGQKSIGNNFDYVYVHGKAIMESGRPFCSSSSEAFCKGNGRKASSIDLICGKQVTSPLGPSSGRLRFKVFTPEMKSAIREFVAGGGNVLVSGSYIGRDIWDRLYEIPVDSTSRADDIAFAKKTLGYVWSAGAASKSGIVKTVANVKTDKGLGKIEMKQGKFSYCNGNDGLTYSIENPDGLSPATSKSSSFLRYADTNISAGIAYDAKTYKTVCVGFPLETLEDKTVLSDIISSTLKYFGD